MDCITTEDVNVERCLTRVKDKYTDLRDVLSPVRTLSVEEYEYLKSKG